MCPPQINSSTLLKTSQPSLEKIFDDQQLLSTALAVELEDVKKALAQLNLEKCKSLHNGLFSLNVDYYIKNLFKELDNIESRVEKLESGEQPAIEILIRFFGSSKPFQSFLTTAKILKERKTKLILIQI